MLISKEQISNSDPKKKMKNHYPTNLTEVLVSLFEDLRYQTKKIGSFWLKLLKTKMDKANRIKHSAVGVNVASFRSKWHCGFNFENIAPSSAHYGPLIHHQLYPRLGVCFDWFILFLRSLRHYVINSAQQLLFQKC